MQMVILTHFFQEMKLSGNREVYNITQMSKL